MKQKTESENLESILRRLEKQFGTGSVFRYGQGISSDVNDVIKTGSVRLDEATGVGGLPLGRIVEVFGPESGGKTTIALHVIAEAQKDNIVCAFIDAEHALDPSYATNIGVNMDILLLSQPDYGEMALEIAEGLVRSGEVGLIVVDSVAALVPRAEVEGEMGDANMGLHARLMSQAMRKLNGIVSKYGSLILFINQVRDKIGVMWGNPETTTGGRALKFYASMRLDIRRIGSIKDKNGNVVANKTRVKIAKNKVAVPFREAVFAIRFGEGIDKITELIELATEYKIINKSGAFYKYKKYKLGQGIENARQFLVDNPKFYNAIKKQLLGE